MNYERLKNHWDKYGYRSYRYQKFEITGLEECEEIYLKETNSAHLKSQLAKGFLEILLNILNDESKNSSIGQYVNMFPIIQYYFVLVDKIKILLNEGEITKDQLNKLGMEYSMKGKEDNIIKVGLTLLRFADSKEALEILSVYSNHNRFIFYSVEGIKEYKKCNSIIFSIAKAAKGYGKILAVTNVEPITEEIRLWLIEEGSNNGFLEPVIVAMIFNEIDCLEYFEDGEKTKKKYDILTRNLWLLYEVREFFNENISLRMASIYWEYYSIYGGDFKSRYIMAYLISLLMEGRKSDNSVINYTLTMEEEEILTYMVQEFMGSDHEEIIKDELKNGSIDVGYIIELAQIFDFSLTFDDFKVRLEASTLQLKIYEYIMMGNSTEEKRKLIDFSIDKIPYEVIAAGAQNISANNMDDEFMADSCLFILISNMGDLTKEYMELCISALKARYTPTRMEAVKNIHSIENEELLKYSEEIMEISQEEVDKKIKKALLTLVRKHNNHNKLPRIKNINTLAVSAHPKDILLTNIILQKDDSVDIDVITDNISVGNIVSIQYDKMMVYNGDSIVVITSSGYVLGCIPENKSEILKNLMDSSKILYGKILEGYNLNLEIEISIYLSYLDVAIEITNTLNMVTEKPVGYLN